MSRANLKIEADKLNRTFKKNNSKFLPVIDFFVVEGDVIFMVLKEPYYLYTIQWKKRLIEINETIQIDEDSALDLGGFDKAFLHLMNGDMPLDNMGKIELVYGLCKFNKTTQTHPITTPKQIEGRTLEEIQSAFDGVKFINPLTFMNGIKGVRKKTGNRKKVVKPKRLKL